MRHRHQLTAIHANGLKELSLSLPAALVSRVPLVVWVHNFAVPPSVRIFGWLWRVLPRRDVRWAAVSPLARDIAVGAGLVAADDVVIVPNPIDADDVVAPERAARTRDGRLPGSAPAVQGFRSAPRDHRAVGAPHPRRLARVLAPDRRRSRQDVGSAARDGRRRAGVARGQVPRRPHRVRAMDVVVCPSVLESFCRVAAEAMLNGIPVVGSDLAPIRALLGDDEAGLLFPVGDTHRAAEAIARLVADGGLGRSARLGGGGRRPTTRRASVASCSLLGRRSLECRERRCRQRCRRRGHGRGAADPAPQRAAPRPGGGRHRRAPTNAPGLDRGRPGRDRRKPDSALVAELGGGVGLRQPRNGRGHRCMSVRHEREPDDSGSASRAGGWRGPGQRRHRDARRTAAWPGTRSRNRHRSATGWRVGHEAPEGDLRCWTRASRARLPRDRPSTPPPVDREGDRVAALAGDGHRRQRDIPTVADDVHEPALGEHRRERRDALHVRRHLVAVAGLAACEA